MFRHCEIWCLEPEPLQAAPQHNDRMASQRPQRAVATPRSFRALAIALLDVMPSRSSSAIVPAMDRAKASAARLNGRNASQASFPRWWLAGAACQPARRHGHQRRRRCIRSVGVTPRRRAAALMVNHSSSSDTVGGGDTSSITVTLTVPVRLRSR